jgi:hypothetical protein
MPDTDMPQPLNYRRVIAREGQTLSREGRLTRMLAILAGISFALPFGLLYASGNQADSLVRMVLVILALLLWLAAGMMALFGTIAGGLAVYRERPRAWTIVAAAVNAVVMLIALTAAVGGIIRSLRHGW